jgi:hypothetical protein
MTHHVRLALTLMLTLAFLAGCGSTTNAPSPLGRSFASAPASTSTSAAPIGDPPPERHGTVPEGIASEENRSGSLAATPQAALLRYALTYTNWRASSLSVVERRLVSLAVGAAKLTAEQTAASNSVAAELADDHVQNKGVVLAITPAQGPADGQWVVVTQEQTTGTGPYAGLPPALHVILARTERLNHGWVISGWTPRT